MNRRTQMSLKYANKQKIQKLDELTSEMLRVKNLYIEELWEQKECSKKFIDFKVNSWL